jgi:hypothetical protein
MKLKTASKIQKALWLTIWLLMLPFSIVGIFIDSLVKPFRWVLEELDFLRFRIGNKLLRMSDEVKGGTIQNKYVIRNFTATEAYLRLKIEQQQQKQK